MNHPNTETNHSDQDSTTFVSKYITYVYIYIFYLDIFRILMVDCFTYFTHFKKYS